ncbi:hypothetical protein JHK82_047876 [Glycine max]|nr:hypothetical protein JHK82_047876 [Glycine max]
MLPLRKLRFVIMEQCGRANLGANLPRYYPFEDVQAIKDNINDEITALEHLDANDIDGLHEQRLQQIKKITEMSSLALTMEKKYDCFVAALEKIVGNKTSNEIYVRFASLYDSIVLEQFDLYGQNDIHREHVQLENEGRKAKGTSNTIINDVIS